MTVGLASNRVPQFGSRSHPGEGLSEFIEELNCVLPLCSFRRKALHLNSAVVSISVIQGDVIRGSFIQRTRLLGGT